MSLGVTVDREGGVFEAEVVGFGSKAVDTEGVDELEEGLEVAEAECGGPIEGEEGVGDEAGGGEAVEEGAEGGAVGEGGEGGEEGPGTVELKVLSEDVYGGGKSGGRVGEAGGGRKPVEEFEGAVPVVGVGGKRGKNGVVVELDRRRRRPKRWRRRRRRRGGSVESAVAG